MSAPPHSVATAPAALAEDEFRRRNDFLYLLLGLISTAETVLRVAPELVPAERPAGRPARGQDDGTLLR